MSSRRSEGSADEEDTILYCGNCGVKLEIDPLNGYEQLSLKGPLYIQGSSSSVTVCEALSSIFKVKVPLEIGDSALCYDCTTILQQLYTIWQSFVVKFNPSTVLYPILTDEKTQIGGNGDVLNCSELLTQSKRTTKARLKAKMARGRRRGVQSIQDKDMQSETLQHSKRTTNDGTALYPLRRRTQNVQENKVEAPLTQSNITSSLYMYVDTERNGTHSVPVLGVKRKRGRPRRDDDAKNQTPNSSSANESLLTQSASTSHVLHVEVDSVLDTTASTSTAMDYESDNDEFEAEDPLQITVDLAESETLSVAVTSIPHELKEEKEPSEIVEKVGNQLDAVLNFDSKLPSVPLSPVTINGNTTNLTETEAEDSSMKTRRSRTNPPMRTPNNLKPGDSKNEQLYEDFSTDSDSESDSNGIDSDFDPDDVDTRDRDKDLEKFNRINKIRTKRVQREVEIEIATTGQTSRKFSCKKCGRGFRKQMWLDKHIDVVHLKIRSNKHQSPYICTFEDCGKKLRDADALEGHINQHLGRKPFICDQCAWSTTRNSLLRVHLQTHLKAEEKEKLKTKVCHVCGGKFKKGGELSAHLLVHVEDRPYACSFEGCQHKFKSATKLQRHEQEIHLDANQKFSCQRCGREFGRKDNLFRHLKVHEKYESNGGKMRKSRDPPVRNLTKKAVDSKNSNKNRLTKELL